MKLFAYVSALITLVMNCSTCSAGVAYADEQYIDADHPTFTTSLRSAKVDFRPGFLPARVLSGEPVAPKLIDAELPAHFDWREVKALSPVKDQGNCGSCWSFSGTAIIEASLILRGFAESLNLSEQFRVGHDKIDGNSGCSGGGLHMTHTVGGSVLESECPYRADNSKCPAGYKLVYPMKEWGYVNGDVTVPSVEELKRAIWTYGPLSVAVAVAGNFTAYKSGVYNESASGSLNHAVVLVGWDDAGKYWIMRNSWNVSWGEAGHMRIKWGSRKVGAFAAWVSPDGKTMPHGDVTPEPTPTPAPQPTPCPTCPEVKPCPKCPTCPDVKPCSTCPESFGERVQCLFKF